MCNNNFDQLKIFLYFRQLECVATQNGCVANCNGLGWWTSPNEIFEGGFQTERLAISSLNELYFVLSMSQGSYGKNGWEGLD